MRTCTSPHNVGPLPDGTYAFEVRARDATGNVDPTPASRTFTIDTTAPDTLIDTGPPPTIHAGPISFTVRVTEAGTIECSLDGAAYGSCATPTPPAEDLALGEHVYRARATDQAGNTDTTPAEWRFTVTNAAPEATLQLDLSASTVVAGLNATDADGDSLAYALDFGDGERVEGTLPVDPIEHRYGTAGEYTVRLDVKDARATTTQTRSITVAPPQPSPRLDLHLSIPAGFGTFTAGVTRDYTTTVAATIDGTGTLRMADLSGTATGHLAGASGALPQPIQAGGQPLTSPLRLPVTDGTTTIEFKQPIAATDVLRTGTYTKRLTFTLTPPGP